MMKTNLKELMQLHTKMLSTICQLEEAFAKREHLKRSRYYQVFGTNEDLVQDLEKNLNRIEALTAVYEHLKEKLNNCSITLTSY